MPNTPKGLPYPNPTDPVQQGAAAIQALANAVDARLEITGRISAAAAIVQGTGFTVVKAATGLYTVTFTTAFAAAPVVVVNCEVAGMAADAVNVAANSFQASITDVVANAASDRQFSFMARSIQ